MDRCSEIDMTAANVIAMGLVAGWNQNNQWDWEANGNETWLKLGS